MQEDQMSWNRIFMNEPQILVVTKHPFSRVPPEKTVSRVSKHCMNLLSRAKHSNRVS